MPKDPNYADQKKSKIKEQKNVLHGFQDNKKNEPKSKNKNVEPKSGNQKPRKKFLAG